MKALFHRAADLPFDRAMDAGREANALMRSYRTKRMTDDNANSDTGDAVTMSSRRRHRARPPQSPAGAQRRQSRNLPSHPDDLCGVGIRCGCSGRPDRRQRAGVLRGRRSQGAPRQNRRLGARAPGGSLCSLRCDRALPGTCDLACSWNCCRLRRGNIAGERLHGCRARHGVPVSRTPMGHRWRDATPATRHRQTPRQGIALHRTGLVGGGGSCARHGRAYRASVELAGGG